MKENERKLKKLKNEKTKKNEKSKKNKKMVKNDEKKKKMKKFGFTRKIFDDFQGLLLLL